MIRRCVAAWVAIGMAASVLAACKSSGKSEADGAEGAKDASADSGAGDDSSTGGAKQTASKKDAGAESENAAGRPSTGTTSDGGSGRGGASAGGEPNQPQTTESGGSGGAAASADQASATGGTSAVGTEGTGGAQSQPASISISNCDDLGQKVCSRLDECGPFLMEAYYGTRQPCQDLFTGICEYVQMQNTGIDYARCAAALAECGNFVAAQGVPDWCWNSRGAAKLGQECFYDTDCSEGLCVRAKADSTGTCNAAASEGESCIAPARCDIGLRCVQPDCLCARPAAEGQSCTSPLECQVGSTCSSENVCTPTREGDTCLPTVFPCDLNHGQSCSGNTCRELTLIVAEGDCQSGVAECRGTRRCVTRQAEPLVQESKCSNTASVGEACDGEVWCIQPLSCRSGTCEP